MFIIFSIFYCNNSFCYFFEIKLSERSVDSLGNSQNKIHKLNQKQRGVGD